MKKFVASMISKGNHLFQASISIDDDGIIVKIPGFWKNEEAFFKFDDITGIRLELPKVISLLSYATIGFNARGVWTEAHGFTTRDAKAIERLIKAGQKNSAGSRSSKYPSNGGGYDLDAKRQRDWINYQHDKEVKEQRRQEYEAQKEEYLELIPKYVREMAKLIARTEFFVDNDGMPHMLGIKGKKGSTWDEIEQIAKELDALDNKLNKLLKYIYDDHWKIEKKIQNEKMVEMARAFGGKKDNVDGADEATLKYKWDDSDDETEKDDDANFSFDAPDDVKYDEDDEDGLPLGAEKNNEEETEDNSTKDEDEEDPKYTKRTRKRR